MRPFRFSFNFFGVEDRDAFVDKCQRIENSGYDVALAPDHLGAPSPFPLLVAAASATDRLRVERSCSTCRSGTLPCWRERSQRPTSSPAVG